MQGGDTQALLNDRETTHGCYPDRTRGTALTKYDPYFHDDGNGGLVCRVITDDGAVFNRAISRERALRMIADLALFAARDIAASER